MKESTVSKPVGSKGRNPPSRNKKVAFEKKDFKRSLIKDARTIVSQTSDAALKNGQLDIQSFLQSREFEIKALQNAMQSSKKSLNIKSLQKVPRDMRRRTASHNVKRLPKRLHKKAEKEMKDGNTPTVTASKRKPSSSRGRIRSETAKKLGLLAAKKRAEKQVNEESSQIETRSPRPKLKKDQLIQPPRPKSKFRKRQISKTWLPTHIWHSKRARMTEPKNPLWRFAIPLTPTEKSYRPTHRSGGARGAIMWDTSYMSTIMLESLSGSLENLLKAMGLTENWLWEEKGLKWRNGKRSWTGWLSRQYKDEAKWIGPSTIFWCPEDSSGGAENATEKAEKKSLRRVFIRVHPAAFLETWTELTLLSKLHRPKTQITDLRFEIGSIELTGPGSTEALLGILHPFFQEDSQEAHAKTFTSLSGVTNAGSLPLGAILSFSIMDPRLRYPPRPVKIPLATDKEAQLNLLQLLSQWPPDNSSCSMNIHDQDARFKAIHFPSQKAINRRKGLAAPGSYPNLGSNDPPIPIVLLASRSNASTSIQGNWTLLAPWKCISPIWLGLVHYPLSSGGNPRFGGLEELQQITFEQGKPWFPGDYPGTHSGFSWEIDGRLKRKAEWEKRPRGKRIEWDSLNLGIGRKGEVGCGWSNDFERLLKIPQGDVEDISNHTKIEDAQELLIRHIPGKNFRSLLSKKLLELPELNTVATVRITLIGRGVARPCARIYRLPRETSSSNPSSLNELSATIREQWLSLLPPTSGFKSKSDAKSKRNRSLGRIPPNTPLPERVELLARSLIKTPPLQYPADRYSNESSPPVPEEEDLIGFVTTGKYCLSRGSGVAFGTILVNKMVQILGENRVNKAKFERICIVRNSGENTGWLARWEVTQD